MRTGNAATLKWAERRALERLTCGDDKLYLYEMLSELADEARDAKVYIARTRESRWRTPTAAGRTCCASCSR